MAMPSMGTEKLSGHDGIVTDVRTHPGSWPRPSLAGPSILKGDCSKPKSRQQRASPSLSTRSCRDSFTRFDIPASYVDLDNLGLSSSRMNPDGGQTHRHELLYGSRLPGQECCKTRANKNGSGTAQKGSGDQVSRFVTQLYTISYLILFAILGTLARLGLQGLTFYPGAPVVFSELWANFGGSLLMGFLGEDRTLFRGEWGGLHHHHLHPPRKTKEEARDEERGSVQPVLAMVPIASPIKAHSAAKKTIPLYIGLTIGFCGSFTSFSSFIRDIFLALSNDLPTPLSHPSDYTSITTTIMTVPRNGGYSFMAIIAVIIITVAVCISGLHVGAHLANALEPFTPTLSFSIVRKIIDPLAAILAWISWLGAISLAIWPPDRHLARPEIWRGRAIFSLVFAPLGCLARFYASLHLNGRIISFPLGTFAVNILGTIILGMVWDLQHATLGGVIGCQVLQGIEDGFCGCLTTVSTWVSELNALKRSQAYKYGAGSVVLALSCLVAIMGSLRWTRGFSPVACIH